MALQQLHERLYDGSTITHIVTYIIVGTNRSASSLRRLDIVSTMALPLPIQSPIQSTVRMALHRLYERPCIVSINGPASSLQTALYRLYERLYDGSTTALQRFYDTHSIVRTNVSTIVPTDGSAMALQQLNKRLYKWLYLKLYQSSTRALLKALPKLYLKLCTRLYSAADSSSRSGGRSSSRSSSRSSRRAAVGAADKQQ
jgi:hypothetical protein